MIRHNKTISYTAYISIADGATVYANINCMDDLILLAKSNPWYIIELVRHTYISEPGRIKKPVKNSTISQKTASIVLVCPENLTPDDTNMSANWSEYKRTNVSSDLTKGGKIPQNVCAFFGINNDKER
jgi:Pyruvate/2-oxoacid:ferredoxin oxidoreductase delta subunit